MDAPRLVRTNYLVRTGAFAYCFLALGVHLWGERASILTWLLLGSQFLVYPHLVYQRALHSARPREAEIDNLYLDATLLGLWCAALGFPTWITYALLAGTLLNATVNRGLAGAAFSFACSVAGAGLYLAVGAFAYRPGTSVTVTFLFFFGVLAYTCAVGCVVHRQARGLLRARDAMRLSEERHRLIAENVADLIGMADQAGRWLYASPSYSRVLAPQDLAPGADAFGRAHPDDAEQARVALARAAATRKAREVPLRLVDRDGRVRQYRMRIQPLAGEAPATSAPAERLLLVSQDVTDLRESEEKLLLAAHALEGMTEAILITAADGTVLSVNRAFTELTGHARDEVLGQPEKAVRQALQPPQHYDEIYATVQREGYWSGTLWSRRRNGSVYREWRSIRAVRDAAGRTTHYVHVFYEVGAPRHRNGQAGAGEF